MEAIKCSIDNITIGIPSKGRLKPVVIEFLAKCELTLQLKMQRQLQATILENPNYRVVLAHPKDIPGLLEREILDVGFTGLDILQEQQTKLRSVVKTNDGKAKICLMVPKNTEYSHPCHLMDKTIATSYPNITQEYFDKLKIKINIHFIHGASEGVPYLGFVDAIVDVVSTGTTAAANNLKIIADDIFESECVAVVAKPELQCNYQAVNDFLRRIYQ